MPHTTPKRKKKKWRARVLPESPDKGKTIRRAKPGKQQTRKKRGETTMSGVNLNETLKLAEIAKIQGDAKRTRNKRRKRNRTQKRIPSIVRDVIKVLDGVTISEKGKGNVIVNVNVPTKKKGGGWFNWGKKKEKEEIMSEFKRGRAEARYREHMKKNPLKQVGTIEDAFAENLPKTDVHIVDDKEIKRLEENLRKQMVGRAVNLTGEGQEFPTNGGGKRKRKRKRKRKGGGKKEKTIKRFQKQTKPYKIEIIKYRPLTVQIWDYDKKKKEWVKVGKPTQVKRGGNRRRTKKRALKKRNRKKN
tara:strand:- start:568 stop:1473 length:906 start_codon:yes stop_codon:yes gene_type:complete